MALAQSIYRSQVREDKAKTSLRIWPCSRGVLARRRQLATSRGTRRRGWRLQLRVHIFRSKALTDLAGEQTAVAELGALSQVQRGGAGAATLPPRWGVRRPWRPLRRREEAWR